MSNDSTDPTAAMPAAAAAPAAPLPCFTVTPYRPDGGFEVAGLVMLTTALLMAAAVLGYAAHWVSQYFYLIVMFPLGIGLVLGAVGVRMVRQGRLRNPWLGGAAGFLGGVLAMTMMHYFDYQQLHTLIASLPEEVRQVAALPPQERQQWLADLAPEERTKAEKILRIAQIDSVLAYMHFEAEQGVTLKRGGSRDRGMNLGYVGSWVYWAIEVLIVAGVTFAMVRESTMQPYCAPCARWKSTRTLGTVQGQAGIAAAKAGDLAGLAADRTPGGPITVKLAVCDECAGQGPIDLKLELVTLDKKGNKSVTMKAHCTYPPEALPYLEAAFPTAPPSPAQ